MPLAGPDEANGKETCWNPVSDGTENNAFIAPNGLGTCPLAKESPTHRPSTTKRYLWRPGAGEPNLTYFFSFSMP
jgi:hypothetical protein